MTEERWRIRKGSGTRMKKQKKRVDTKAGKRSEKKMRDKRDWEDIWRTWEGRKKARCVRTTVGES